MIENESPFRKAELMQGRGDLLEGFAGVLMKLDR